MKKTFVLLTIVLALLAAPVFAEVAFSGEANFGISSDFAAKKDAGKDGKDGFAAKLDTLKLGVKGSVGEFTSVTFDLKVADLGKQNSWGNFTAKDSVKVDKFVVATDVTGAMGLDLPVDVKLVTGFNDYFEAKKFHAGDGYGLAEIGGKAGKFWSLGADVKIVDMVTLRIGGNAWMQSGVNTDGDSYVQGLFIGAFVEELSGLSAEVYYVLSAAEYEVLGTKIKNVDLFGLDAAYALDLDGMKITPSAAFMMLKANEKKSNPASDSSAYVFGAGVNFEMDAINAGLSFKGTAPEDEDTVMDLGFDAGYKINDMFKVYAGVKLGDMTNDMYFTDKAAAEDGVDANSGADLGVQMTFGEGVDYFFGYQLGAGKLNNLTEKEGLYLSVKVKF